MDDATTRARIVLQQYLLSHDIECHRPSTATRMVKAITESGLALYDTRTHAAIAALVQEQTQGGEDGDV